MTDTLATDTPAPELEIGIEYPGPPGMVIIHASAPIGTLSGTRTIMGGTKQKIYAIDRRIKKRLKKELGKRLYMDSLWTRAEHYSITLEISPDADEDTVTNHVMAIIRETLGYTEDRTNVLLFADNRSS